MRKGLRFIAALVAGFVASLAPALAWDFPGHRIVGGIADMVLETHYPAAHARVLELLAIKDANGNVVEQRTLAQASAFPDCARPNNVVYCGRPPSAEEAAYAACNPQHAKYHYTSVPLQQPGYSAGSAGTDDRDVVQMIAYITQQLRGRKPAPKPEVDLADTEALWLLAHLVGDIHQPMHVGTKYYDATCETSVDPNVGGTPPRFGIGSTVAHTAGGNRIAIAVAAPAVPPAKNLHLYWDITPVVRAMQAAALAGAEREFTRVLAAAPPEGWQTAGAPETWAVQWASEMMPLAVEAHERLTIRKSAVKAPLAGQLDCSWEVTLDAAYEDWARDRTKVQLAKAGFRLAALINAIFTP